MRSECISALHEELSIVGYHKCRATFGTTSSTFESLGHFLRSWRSLVRGSFQILGQVNPSQNMRNCYILQVDTTIFGNDKGMLPVPSRADRVPGLIFSRPEQEYQGGYMYEGVSLYTG